MQKRQGKAELAVIELVFYLKGDGTTEFAMIGAFDLLGLQLNPAQNKTLLDTFNQFNNAKKSDLDYYKIKPMILCPYLFGLLKWRRNEGLLPERIYQKHMKFYLTSILHYFTELYEQASLPSNVGLRGLLFQESLVGAQSYDTSK